MLHRVWRAAAPAAAEARALAWVSWQRGARPSGAAARAAWPSARTHARIFFSGALPNLSPQQVTDTSGRNTGVRCVRCSDLSRKGVSEQRCKHRIRMAFSAVLACTVLYLAGRVLQPEAGDGH